MKKLKVIIAVLMCSVIIIVGSLPASALVGELTLGTGALVGIVISGLLASGVAISASGGLEQAAQAVIAAMPADLQQELLLLKAAEVGGQAVALWTSATWNKFTQFVKSNFISSGATSIIISSESVITSDSLVTPTFWASVSLSSSNFGIVTQLGNASFQITNVTNWGSDARRFYYDYRFTFDDFALVANNNQIIRNSDVSSYPGIINVSAPFVASSGQNLRICLSPLNSVTSYYTYGILVEYLSQLYKLEFNSGVISLSLSNSPYTTYNLTSLYSNLHDYVVDIVNSNHLVGVLPGTDTYVYPTPTTAGEAVTADVFPNSYVGTGVDSLPETLTDGATIAIPIPAEIDDGTITIPDVDDRYKDLAPDDVLPDVIIQTAIPDVAYPDAPELPDDGSEDSPDDKANKMRFPAVAKEKFPFCIPFDFFNAIQMLSAPAQIPEYDIPFVVPSINFEYNVHLDFSDFETVAKVLRWFLAAGWILTLILLTKSIIK